jgi:hypothetical protein
VSLTSPGPNSYPAPGPPAAPQQGWQCPTCGNVYAPTWFQCMTCSKGTFNFTTNDPEEG